MGRILIQNGRIVDPANRIDATGDLLIADDKIERVGGKIEVADGAAVDVIYAEGLIVTPGLIDMHVHLREPGFEHKETIATGTRAAEAGGFTSVASMANTDPASDSPEVIEFVKTRARESGSANVFPLGSITKMRSRARS